MNCDKCGQPVPESNDAAMLEFIATNNWKLLGATRRHLFPTEICEGSPSRVTMIDKNPAWKKAYQKLLKRKATPQSGQGVPR